MNVPLYGDEFRKLFGNMTTLSPSAQDEPNMTIKVTAGGFWSFLDGVPKYVEYVGGSSPTITVPPSNAKWVAVCLTPGGQLTVLDGSPSANPLLPSIPKNRYPVALVYVERVTTAITNSMVFDARPVFSLPVQAHTDLQGTAGEDCHPISAIAGLNTVLETFSTLSYVDEQLELKADGNGTVGTKFILNKDFTGPTGAEDCSIEVERGASVNVAIRWDETAGKWVFTNDGITWYPLYSAADDLSLKTYNSSSAPILSDGAAAIWIDDSSNVFLVYKPVGLTQVKVQLQS